MHSRPLWFHLLPDSITHRLKSRAGLLAAVHNAGWLFADKAMRMAVGVLVSAWMARYLGPGQFGQIAYVLSMVALFSAMAQLGLDGVAIRDIARCEGDAPGVLGAVLRLRLLAGFVSWMGAVAAVALLLPGDSQSLLLTAIAGAGLVLQAADTVDLWFQSKSQSRRTVFAKGYAFLAANGIKVALILTKAPLWAFMAVGVVELSIAALILGASYRRFPAHGPWAWHTRQATRLLREAMPYLAASLAVMIYMRIDQLMLRSMVGEHALGLYSAALPLSTALHFVPMALCSSLAPALSRMHQHDPARYERAIGQVFSAMWWLMLPLAGLVALFAERLVHWLYGPDYAGSAPILALHVGSAVPVALGVAQSLWIVNANRNMMSLYRTLLGALCNVGLNLLLIPLWGGLGAAAAAVAAQTVAAVLSNAVLAPQMLRLQWIALVQPLRNSRRQSST